MFTGELDHIQFVYHTKGSRLQTTVGQAQGIKAMREVEYAHLREQMNELTHPLDEVFVALRRQISQPK